jgi:hypothetical protein
MKSSLFMLLVVTACHRNGAPAREASVAAALPVCPPDTGVPVSPLRATLRVREPRAARIQDLAVEVTLTNPTAAPVRWLSTYVEAGSFALEVRDSWCARIASGPPPTPRVDDGVTNWNTLAPGASVPLAFQGWVMSDVPPGRYEVRFRGIPGDTANADARSPWVPFEVATPSQ